MTAHLLVLAAGGFCASYLRAEEIPAGFESLSRTNASRVIDVLTDPYLLREKPQSFASLSQRLDYVHENLTHGLGQRMVDIDVLFSDGSIPLVHSEKGSRFRIGLYTSIKKQDDTEVRFVPEFSADVDMPNIQQRWGVFISTRGYDELPGVDPVDQDSRARIGVVKKSRRRHFRWKTGVKMSSPPELFTKVEWREKWKWGDWEWDPYVNAYLETRDGWGQLSSMNGYYWFGKQKDWSIKLTSAGIWGETVDDYEVEQSIGLGRVTAFVEERHKGGPVHRKYAAKGYGARYTAFGVVGDASVLTRHRLSLMYRFPIYGRWLYGEVMPELEWRDEDDWDFVPTLKIGVEALLWADRGR